MITKQIGTDSYRFGVAVKDDGYGNLCLANLRTGVYGAATSWFKDLAYPGKSNSFARHTYSNSGGQGSGLFTFTKSGSGYQFYPCWQYGVVNNQSEDEFLCSARPKSTLVTSTIYGSTSTYVAVSPYSPYDPDTGVLTIHPIGVSTLYSNYNTLFNRDTDLGSMICNFSDHPYMAVQLITLRTVSTLGVTEWVVENKCGVIGGGLPGMQWGYRRTRPTWDSGGYLDANKKMISSMGTGIPTPPTDTSTAVVINYGAWTYHKVAYNGETTYFIMRYVYLGKWASGLGSSDRANTLMEPGLYCNADKGPTVVETVVAAARLD